MRKRLSVIVLVSLFAAAGIVPAGAGEVVSRETIVESLWQPISGGPAIDLAVEFRIGSAKLTKRARTQLDELGHALSGGPLKGAEIGIYGHTDASGGARNNKRLSQKRAEAVRDYLVKSFSLDPALFDTFGYGEEQLKNTRRPNAAENRRVEIVNLSPPKAQDDGGADGGSEAITE